MRNRPILSCLIAAALATMALAATADAPGGLYVGYYQEDPATNPEDPTAGAFSLTLPEHDGDFHGSMDFTYVGCQSVNVGSVGGAKAGAALSGQWSGTLDGSPQGGGYSGRYDAAKHAYAGVYDVAGGKQYRDLSPCISYWIAPNGTWEMFPVDTSVPDGFVVTADGRGISWSSVGAPQNLALVYLMDADAAGSPVLWQTLLFGPTRVALPPSLALRPHRRYIAAVALSDGHHERVAFGSRRFTTP